MSAPAQTITVIRLVRIGPSEATSPSRGVVAGVMDATLAEDADARAAYLLVPHDRALTRESGERRQVADIQVGDVIAWVAEPYGALWVAEQTDAVPTDDPERANGAVDSARAKRSRKETPCSHSG